MSDDNLYAYGVVDADDALELEVTDVTGEERTARTVSHGPLAAVVTDIDDLEPPETEEHLQRHDDVLQAVMQHGDGRTIVPMQYGMAFKNARALKNVLRSGRRAFTKALREVDGMVELGVKVVGPADGSADVDVESEIAAPLSELAVNEADNDLFSDRLLLNRSYLVERDDRGDFDDEIDRIEAAHPELQIKYTGPWAAYNFVDIEIEAQQH